MGWGHYWSRLGTPSGTACVPKISLLNQKIIPPGTVGTQFWRKERDNNFYACALGRAHDARSHRISIYMYFYVPTVPTPLNLLS